MSRLFVAEYLDPACTEPPIAEQTVAINSSSTASLPFGHLTRGLRLHADAPCSLAFGENPEASSDNQRMAGGATEKRLVPQGARLRVAAIASPDEDQQFDIGQLVAGLEAVERKPQ
jgi:hypothetical protein